MARAYVRLDEQQLAEVTELLKEIKNGVPKALSGAINDTAARQRTRISADIRGKVNIKKRDIDGHITIKKATVKNPSGWVKLQSSRRLSLSYFGGRQTKTGIAYKIDKAGGRQAIAGGFLVAKRHLKNAPPDATGTISFRRQGKKRLKIVALKGPTAYAVFLKAGLLERTERDTAALLQVNVGRRVNMLILKHKGVI